MKKILSVILVAVMVLSLSASIFAEKTDYSDRIGNTKVDLQNENSDVVVSAKVLDALYAAGVLKGDGQAPDAKAKLTRWQVAMIILRAINVYKDGVKADLNDDNWADYAVNYGDYDFADIDETSYVKSLGALCYCVEEGLIVGSLDGGKLYLKPNDNVTFAEAVTILVRALGWTSTSMNISWPYFYMAQAAKINLTAGIKGIANNDEVTYGTIAQLVYNFLNSNNYCNDIGKYENPENDVNDVLSKLGTKTLEFGTLIDGNYNRFVGGDGKSGSITDSKSLFDGLEDFVRNVPKDTKVGLRMDKYAENGLITLVPGMSINDSIKAMGGYSGASLDFANTFRLKTDIRSINEAFAEKTDRFGKGYFKDVGTPDQKGNKLENFYYDGGALLRLSIPDASGDEGFIELLRLKDSNLFWAFYELDDDGNLIKDSRVPALTAYTTAVAADAKWRGDSYPNIIAASPITTAAAWYNQKAGNKNIALVWEVPQIDDYFLAIDVDGELYVSTIDLDAAAAKAAKEAEKLNPNASSLKAQYLTDSDVLDLACTLWLYGNLYGWDFSQGELEEIFEDTIIADAVKDVNLFDIAGYVDEGTSDDFAGNNGGYDFIKGSKDLQTIFATQAGVVEALADLFVKAEIANTYDENYADLLEAYIDEAIAPELKAIEKIYGKLEIVTKCGATLCEKGDEGGKYDGNTIYVSTKAIDVVSSMKWVDADGKKVDENTVGAHIVAVVNGEEVEYAAELCWFAPYGTPIDAAKFNADVDEIGEKLAETAAAWCVDTNGDGKYDLKIYVNFEISKD